MTLPTLCDILAAQSPATLTPAARHSFLTAVEAVVRLQLSGAAHLPDHTEQLASHAREICHLFLHEHRHTGSPASLSGALRAATAVPIANDTAVQDALIDAAFDLFTPPFLASLTPDAARLLCRLLAFCQLPDDDELTPALHRYTDTLLPRLEDTLLSLPGATLPEAGECRPQVETSTSAARLEASSTDADLLSDLALLIRTDFRDGTYRHRRRLLPLWDAAMRRFWNLASCPTPVLAALADLHEAASTYASPSAALAVTLAPAAAERLGHHQPHTDEWWLLLATFALAAEQRETLLTELTLSTPYS